MQRRGVVALAVELGAGGGRGGLEDFGGEESKADGRGCCG